MAWASTTGIGVARPGKPTKRPAPSFVAPAPPKNAPSRNAPSKGAPTTNAPTTNADDGAAPSSVTTKAPETSKDAPLPPTTLTAEVTPAEVSRAKAGEAASAKAAPSNAELERLRADYDRLREQLFRSRVRSQQVEGAVYHARFDATLVWKGRPDFVVTKARVLLDGAEIWDSGDRTETDDKIQVAERPIKPGPHALTVKMEVRPHTEQKGGTKSGLERLGYTSEHTFAITVPDNKKTHALVTADEDGDPPEYEPEMELELENE